jgi:dimeric dUTPase (all-alpha-NTP-PPase superfamily)
MQDLFAMQWKLNEYTLKKIGLDYGATVVDPELKTVWLENYRKALSAELAELVRDVQQYGIGTKNGMIEVVDILHFLLSLSHIAAIDPSQVSLTPVNGVSFHDCVLKTFLALDTLQNSVKWKWWAKGGGYKEDQARQGVLQLWKCFEELCAFYAMDFATVKRVYLAKNALNFQRQDQDYNEETKTEEDNQVLQI